VSFLALRLACHFLRVKYLARAVAIPQGYGMDRRHLRYLIALAEEGTFTRAAERVGIAQPPFSKQIRDMEREIGVDLVRRLPKGAVLTEAGTAFLAQARAIEGRFGAAIEEARRIGSGVAGQLRIGFTESGIFNPAVVDSFLAFRTRAPGIDLVLEEQLSTALIAQMREGALDAAFVRPPFPVDEGWICHPVAREPLAVAVARSHRLASRRSVSLADLREETFVFFHRRVRPGLTDAIISACERAGFVPRAGQGVPKITSALRLAAAGAGIAVVPASMASRASEDLHFLRLRAGGLVAEIALLSRRETSNPALARFIDVGRAGGAAGPVEGPVRPPAPSGSHCRPRRRC
jgi:DNA-binding transcriptional LysR family regulator